VDLASAGKAAEV